MGKRGKKITSARLHFAARLVRDGLSVEQAARRAYVREARLRRVMGLDRKLTEGELMTKNTNNDHTTTLGTQGAAYGSEAMEQMVAQELQAAQASGRQLDRMGAIKKLASEGRVQTISNTHDFEAELRDSLNPTQRAKQEASQGFQREQGTTFGGRTLAESRAVREATRQAQQRTRSASTTGRPVRLSEQDAREERIRWFTNQGYARWDAERRVDWQDQQQARQG